MPGCQVAMAKKTAAATTATRTTIDAMCTLTIDCRCDTCIDGMTRYQWPRIIAVHAPPSMAAELRKLAMVRAWTGAARPAAASNAWATSATNPPPQATETISGLTDASVRPTVAQYTRTAISVSASAPNANGPATSPGDEGRNARATARRIAASPALKRKNFTPASRETKTS